MRSSWPRSRCDHQRYGSRRQRSPTSPAAWSAATATLARRSTYGVDGSAASVEPGFDLQKVTAYGTLYLNSSTGAYKFVADNAAIQALDSGDPNVLLDFDVSVTDGDTTDSDTLTITIDGANDAVELAAVSDATINDTAADDRFADVTGSLVGSDRDAGETLTYDVDGSAASVEPGFDLQKVTAYGTLYLNSSTGAYKFVADNAAIQALDSGDPNVLLDFDVSVTDGDTTDSDTLTITIDGANDTPLLTGTQATLPAGTEDTSYIVSAASLLAGFTDADGDTLAVFALSADHGSVTDNGNGTYTINPAADYNGLVTLSYSVVDGNGGSVPASLSFNLAAVNDPAVIAGPITGTVVEATPADPGTPTASGTLTAADVDNPPNTFIAVASTATATGYGSYTMSASGLWTYTLNNANATVNALATGAFLIDTFTVQSADGTTQTINRND